MLTGIECHAENSIERTRNDNRESGVACKGPLQTRTAINATVRSQRWPAVGMLRQSITDGAISTVPGATSLDIISGRRRTAESNGSGCGHRPVVGAAIEGVVRPDEKNPVTSVTGHSDRRVAGVSPRQATTTTVARIDGWSSQ